MNESQPTPEPQPGAGTPDPQPQSNPTPNPGPYALPAGPAPAGGAEPLSSEARTWALFCHLAALSGYFSGLGFWLGPLIVWLVKRDEIPLVNDQGREALNFQLTVLFAAIALTVLTFVSCGFGIFVTAPLGVALSVYQLVMTVVAGIRANKGETYRYPFTLRLL
jgi:uncharacterized protein